MFRWVALILLYSSFQCTIAQARPINVPTSSKSSSSSISPIITNDYDNKKSGLLTNEICMPAKGITSFTISLGIPTGTIDSTSGGGNIETKSGTETHFDLAYGVTDKFSVYGNFENLDRRSSFNTTPATNAYSIGLGDFSVGVKGLLDKTTNWLYYDVSAIKASKSTINTELTTGETSPGSVRPSFNFKIGFGLPNPSFTFGLNYTYSMYQSGESSNTNSGSVTSTTSHQSGNGMSWQMFLQSTTFWRFGFSYKETRIDSYTKETSGVSSTNNANTTLLPAIYLLVPMGPAADVILTAYKPISKNSSATQNYYLGRVQLRLLF